MATERPLTKIHRGAIERLNSILHRLQDTDQELEPLVVEFDKVMKPFEFELGKQQLPMSAPMKRAFREVRDAIFERPDLDPAWATMQGFRFQDEPTKILHLLADHPMFPIWVDMDVEGVRNILSNSYWHIILHVLIAARKKRSWQKRFMAEVYPYFKEHIELPIRPAELCLKFMDHPMIAGAFAEKIIITYDLDREEFWHMLQEILRNE